MKKIVKGNDFTLRIPVMKMVDGEKVPFPLPSCTDIVVRVTNSFKRMDLEYTIDVAEDNVILARVEGDKMSLGTYAVEVKGKIFGNDWRSNEYPQFQIVNKNADADYEFGATDEGDNSVEMDTALVILPPSKELESLIEGANNIDVDLNDSNLEITRKDGEKKNFDLSTLKGEKGEDGKVQDVLVDGKSVLDGAVAKIDMTSHTFLLGNDGQVAGPYKSKFFEFARPIFTLKDNSEYMYANISDDLPDDTLPLYIYDVTLSRYIEITKNHYIEDPTGDFFNTSEPLDLAHELYLDNDKTGNIASLDKLEIETSDLFVGLPYLCTSDELDDDNNEGKPQYIYDATSKRWITVLESWYSGGADYFSTAEPLDLTHEFKYSDGVGYIHSTASGVDSTALGRYSKASGNYSTALGYNSTASGVDSTALGYYSTASGVYSTALGYYSKASGVDSTALGYYSTASGVYSTALGYYSKASGNYSTALGFGAISPYKGAIAIGDIAKANGTNAVAIGYNTEAKLDSSTALGYSAVAGGKYAIALGKNVSNTKSIFGVGFNGINGIDMDRDNYGLFLRNFGGYDGTNLVVKDGTTEKLNPNIKSVQQIINAKADLVDGKVPLSQLGNVDTQIVLVVDKLPTDDIKANKIYLVPNANGSEGNVYTEYVYFKDKWEKLGEYQPKIDLSLYAKKEDLDKFVPLGEDGLIPDKYACMPIIEKSDAEIALAPNRNYDITIGSALALTLVAPTDTSVTNEYQGSFDTGSTAPTVTWPANVVWADTPSIEANTHYEFNIRYTRGKYYGLVQSWNTTEE